jgi:PAS domain S-box-containing protein
MEALGPMRLVAHSFHSTLGHRRFLLLVGTCLVVCSALYVVSVTLPHSSFPFGHRIEPFAVLGAAAAAWVMLRLAWLDARRDAATIEQLREREARLQLFLAQMPSGAWTTDVELRITSLVGSVRTEAESTPEDLVGRTLYDVLGTNDATKPAIAAHLQALGGTGAAYERCVGERTIAVRVEPLRDGDGAVIGCVGVGSDVTERRAAERRLQLLADALEGASDMISVTDADNRFVYVNEGFQRAYGFVREEVLGRTPALLGASADQRQEILAATMQGGWSGDLVNRRKDGTPVPVSLHTSVIRDSEGRMLGLLGVARDISERRRSEEALQRSQERFELAALATDEILWEQDFATGAMWWSRGLERVLGDTPESVRTGEEWWGEIVHPADRERVQRGWRQAVEGRDRFWASEFRLRRSDAEYAVVSGLGYIVRDAAGKALRMVGALADVSFRKQAETVAGRYVALVESSEDAIISTDLEGVVESWNPAAQKLYGYSAEEMLGRPISVLEPPERAGEGAAFRARLVRGELPPPYQTTRRRRDGSLVEIETALSPILDVNDRLVGVSAVVRDITERKRVAAALERLASFPQVNPMPIVEIDASDNVTFMNPAAVRSVPELKGGARAHPFTAGAWALVSEPGNDKSALGTREVLVGATWYLQHLFVLPDRLHLRIYVSDITQRVAAEHELRESEQQLRALAGHLELAREEERARMARGIHDELGQMLTALRLDLTWLAHRLPEPAPAVKRKIGEMVAMTDETIEAGRRIVADLRPPILDDLGLVPAVQWYAEQLGKRAGLRIHLLTAGGEPALDPRLAIAGYRIAQEALTNVARHAQARNVEVRIAVDGGHLVLEIRDDGCGISASAASDPRSFGIAGMRERVRGRGGTLEISGAHGGGTVVRATIPIERRPTAREPA